MNYMYRSVFPLDWIANVNQLY